MFLQMKFCLKDTFTGPLLYRDSVSGTEAKYLHCVDGWHKLQKRRVGCSRAGVDSGQGEEPGQRGPAPEGFCRSSVLTQASVLGAEGSEALPPTEPS